MWNRTTLNALILINNFIADNSVQNMTKLIEYIKIYDLTDSEIVVLAKGLAESGTTLKLQENSLCDIPSTGGPSSLSTLLCPIYLKLLGNKVLKLGVPGRPAGGIDVLSQIEGYRINPEYFEIQSWLSKSNYVHFIANEEFTPADSKLFHFRKQINALGIPALVISSLLSKKIAVGLKNVGLDVRVWEYGNFGTTFEYARRNSERFNRIASLLGISSKCFITNGMVPQQPFIGRSESLLALKKIFDNKDNEYLRNHSTLCLKMSLAISSNKKIDFTNEDVKNAFFENIEVQGGSKKSFDDIVQKTENEHTQVVRSSKSGFLSINLLKIRETIVEIQNSVHTSKYSDPCGVILMRMSDEYVDRGEVICTLRCESSFLKKFKQNIETAFSISENTNSIGNFEIVTYGKI